MRLELTPLMAAWVAKRGIAVAEATMLDVRKFFNEGSSRAVTTKEFSDFWKSLTDEEKTYYKGAVAALSV